jgi:hypothetical protein
MWRIKFYPILHSHAWLCRLHSTGGRPCDCLVQYARVLHLCLRRFISHARRTNPTRCNVGDDHHVSAVGKLRGVDLVRHLLHVDNPHDVTVKVFADARDTPMEYKLST